MPLTTLERLKQTIRELPTNGEIITRCHNSAPDYQAQESLPVDAEDKSLIIEFDEEMDVHKNERHHASLLNTTLTYIRYRSPPTPNGDPDSAHSIGLSELLEDSDTEGKFIGWVSNLQTEDGDRIAPKTETHFRSAIRQFGDLMGEKGRPTHLENIASISPRKSGKKNDPTPKRSNILHWDECVVPILDSPNVHIRDKAIIAVAWDSGSRPSELFRMQAGHLKDKDDYLLFEIDDSKTYDRTPHLQVSMPYLRKWLMKLNEMTADVSLETSPLSIPPDQPIWTHQQDSDELAKSTFQSIGRKIGNRLGFRRPTNLKQFRKSRASIIASTGQVNQSTLRMRFGWEHGSRSPAHYIAKFNDEANQQIADLDGSPIEIAEDYEEPSPIQCLSCERWSPNHLDDCYWCGAKVTGDEQRGNSEVDRLSEKVETNQATKAKLKDRFSDMDVDGRMMKLALDLVEAMDANPELTKESVVFTLMTEYDGMDIEEVIELLETGSNDLDSIFDEA